MFATPSDDVNILKDKGIFLDNNLLVHDEFVTDEGERLTRSNLCIMIEIKNMDTKRISDHDLEFRSFS